MNITFSLPEEVITHLKAEKDRTGVPMSVQVQRALDLYARAQKIKEKNHEP